MSDEENKRVYGKCNNPNGHGHNYKGLHGFYVFCIEVTLHMLVFLSMFSSVYSGGNCAWKGRLFFFYKSGVHFSLLN